MGKKKAAGAKAGGGRCHLTGCKQPVLEKCKGCVKAVCSEHQYPSDHNCKGAAAPVAPKSNGGGMVVVANSSAKSAKAKKAEGMGKKAEQELISKLLAAKPEALLDELMSFGSASARYESSVVVQALGADSKAVSKAFFGAVSAGIADAAEAAGSKDKLVEQLRGCLSKASAETNLSSTEESRLGGVVSFFGMLVGRDEALARAEETLALGLALCHSSSEKLSKTAGSDILRKVSAARWKDGNDFADCEAVLRKLCDEVMAAKEEDDALRNGLAAAIGGVAGPCGPATCASTVLAPLVAATKKPKNTAPLLSCMRCMVVICKEWGPTIVPFLLPTDFISVSVFEVYDKASSAGRSATKKALTQLVDRLGPRAVRLSVPIFLSGLESGLWRVKAISVQLLGALAKRKVPQLFRDLPIIVPAMMECVRDTKKQVSEAAADALDNLGNMVTNAETLNLMPWLLDALKDPEKVELCLDELMDTTFVNSIDAQSLALIIPVVLRGLRDGTAEVKLKASTTAGNVCALVADVHDMRPFYTLLMTELKKLQDHSRPRVREEALRAKQSLQEDMSLTRRRSSHDAQSNNPLTDASAVQSLTESLDKLGLEARAGDVIFDYIVSSCKMLLFDFLEDLDEDMPRKLVLKHAAKLVEDGFTPFFPGDNQVLSDITESLVHAWRIGQGKPGNEVDEAAANEKDYIVYLPSIILAFASRVLLKRAGLFLERAQRYAIVGMNGVGKTTILNRVAARDIDGFPSDITVYYVQHEILEEDASLSVLGYMERDLAEVAAEADRVKNGRKGDGVREALEKVGFNPDMQEKAVASLSGGWKMRLAIARSMLYNADLLLLDEPTNHLDRAALDWLESYLSSLTDTTIMLVSHDYDFVANVCTRVVHLADLKLTYYDCGFREFQELRPDIVAALPKKDEDGGKSGLDLLMAAAGDDEEAAKLTSNIKPIKFPEGCKLDGIAHRGKPIAQLENVSYHYPGTEKFIFRDVSVKLTLNSRVAILGPNGAGKTTLLKLLVGELELDPSTGDAGKLSVHRNVRLAYIAQHSMHHLEDCIESTPCSYIRQRFYEGQDKEQSKMVTVRLTEEDKAVMQESGEICEIVSRVARGKKLFYEIVKNGRQSESKDFKSLEDLERLSADRPHIMRLVRLFDEKLKFAASGADLRPLTTPELISHLADFGIPSDIAQRKIRWMSGGQKSRLVVAAAMWTRPHVIVLDEPTNYLDNESLSALTMALKTFRGGVLLISHHEGFVSAIAKELWHLGDGNVRVESLKK